MGGVPSVLLLLWCRGGCSAATVAAALTFFPPNPPCYTLRKKDNSEELELVVDEALESTVPTDGVRVATIRSEKGGTCWSKRRATPPASGNPESKENKREDKGSKNKNSSSSDKRSRADRGNIIPLAFYPKANARYTLVYSHGNATDIGAMHDRCAGIADAVGINVLAYDYTGYGAATGSPTEAQTYRDIEAVCAWARKHVLSEGEDGSGNKGHGLILYGQSVGSGPTCYLAGGKSKGNFAGIVLHSPILSGMRVLTESRALSCLDIYPNVDRIARVRCPVMVMHGMKDEEVPWEHGKGIFEAVPVKYRRPPWWVPDRGHNDICEGRRHLREFYLRLKAFVQSLDDETAAPADRSSADESSHRIQKVKSGVARAGGTRSGKEQSRSSLEALKSRHSSSKTTESTESTESNKSGPKETTDCSKSAEPGASASSSTGAESASVREEVA